MFLLNWYREFTRIRLEIKAIKINHDHERSECKSCETLKQQLEIANYEKQQLLNRLLNKPETITTEPIKEGPPIPKPRMIPWVIRKQMLEREDRERAKLLRDSPKPDYAESIKELEKDLDVAEQQRETETTANQKS